MNKSDDNMINGRSNDGCNECQEDSRIFVNVIEIDSIMGIVFPFKCTLTKDELTKMAVYLL
jgi:hypothetical protein